MPNLEIEKTNKNAAVKRYLAYAFHYSRINEEKGEKK